MGIFSHLWPSPWNNAYTALEQHGQAGTPELDAADFPGSPYPIAILDAAYSSPLAYNGVDLDATSANFWASKWWAGQTEMDLSPGALVQTGADSVESAVQWGSDTFGWSSPENREPDAPLANLSPWVLGVLVVLGAFLIWRVTK
jgi:hypothetical protein